MMILKKIDKNIVNADTSNTTNADMENMGKSSIDIDNLKDKIKGKKSGEVRSLIEAKEGVKNVDVKFSFFWVNTVPNDDKKINIKFTVDK